MSLKAGASTEPARMSGFRQSIVYQPRAQPPKNDGLKPKEQHHRPPPAHPLLPPPALETRAHEHTRPVTPHERALPERALPEMHHPHSDSPTTTERGIIIQRVRQRVRRRRSRRRRRLHSRPLPQPHHTPRLLPSPGADSTLTPSPSALSHQHVAGHVGASKRRTQGMRASDVARYDE